jgi:hypothetical protein
MLMGAYGEKEKKHLKVCTPFRSAMGKYNII